MRLFYYQNLTNMRTNNRRQSNDTLEDLPNYKQLYLQCKKNVALFMKHVDTEMSNILQKHQQEKKKLQQEVERLKNQLRDRDHNPQTSIHISKASSLQYHNRRSSQSKISSTVSKETVEECLSKFNRFQFKPKETPQKKIDHEASFISQRRTNTKSICQEEKQNLIPVNLTENNDLGDLKILSVVPRRDKRMKEKKLPDTENVENIKDVLKDIRGKLSSRQKSGLRQKEQQSMNIISPDLFTTRRNKVC